MRNSPFYMPLLVATIATIVTPQLRAQGTQPEHQLGGFVNAVWLERIPLIGGQPDAFRVWTAEDGGRIRVYDSVSDTFTQESIVSDKSETLHDVYLDQYSSLTAEHLFGVAVGTNGEAVWWDSLGHTIWIEFITEPAPGKELWACAVEHEVDGTTIWVAGEDHTLRHSTNRGISWSDATWVVSPAAGAMFTSLDFADWSLAGTSGIVGTDSGELFFTTDGLTWDKGTIHGLPVPAAPLILWDIDFRPGSTTEAFAVGGRVEGNGEGFAWRTTDGGQNWNRVLTHFEATGLARVPVNNTLPGNACSGVRGLLRGKHNHVHYATLYGCHALQNGKAIFCGYGGQVWRYLPNAGTTIDILDSFEFPTGPLWGCHGDGDQEIWLAGQFGVLRHTSDGSRNWQAKSRNTTWRLKDIAFPSDNVGYVVGQSMRIAKTTDGGDSWSEQFAYHSGANLGPGVEAVAAFDNNTVVAIGNNFNGNETVAFQTSDGGQTCWTMPNLNAPLQTPSIKVFDVASADLDAITQLPSFWVCGSTATNWSGLTKSVDGGRTWNEVALAGADYVWNGIATLGTTAVVVVGKKLSTGQTAARLTLNANSATPTWQDIMPNPINGHLRSVAVNGLEMIAVGINGQVFRYIGGSLVLETGSIGMTNENLYQVEMGSNGVFLWAYAVGDHGTMLRTPLVSGVPGLWQTLNADTTDDLKGLALRANSSGTINAWVTGRNPRWGDSTIMLLR